MKWNTEHEKQYQELKRDLRVMESERRDALAAVRNAIGNCRGLIPDTITADALVSIAPALVDALAPWVPAVAPSIKAAQPVELIGRFAPGKVVMSDYGPVHGAHVRSLDVWFSVLAQEAAGGPRLIRDAQGDTFARPYATDVLAPTWEEGLIPVMVRRVPEPGVTGLGRIFRGPDLSYPLTPWGEVPPCPGPLPQPLYVYELAQSEGKERPAESREHVAQTWKTSIGPGVLRDE